MQYFNKISALRAKGNFDSTMCLSPPVVAELQWWVNNLPIAFHFIQAPEIDCIISSDASLTGWDEGPMNNISTGGGGTLAAQ